MSAFVFCPLSAALRPLTPPTTPLVWLFHFRMHVFSPPFAFMSWPLSAALGFIVVANHFISKTDQFSVSSFRYCVHVSALRHS